MTEQDAAEYIADLDRAAAEFRSGNSGIEILPAQRPKKSRGKSKAHDDRPRD